jgi:hypothetical protein
VPRGSSSPGRQCWSAGSCPAFGRRIGDASIGARGGIVDEDIEVAELLRQAGDGVADLGGLANIGCPPAHRATRCRLRQLGRRGLQLGAVEVDEADACAFLQKEERSRARQFRGPRR